MHPHPFKILFPSPITDNSCRNDLCPRSESPKDCILFSLILLRYLRFSLFSPFAFFPLYLFSCWGPSPVLLKMTFWCLLEASEGSDIGLSYVLSWGPATPLSSSFFFLHRNDFFSSKEAVCSLSSLLRVLLPPLGKIRIPDPAPKNFSRFFPFLPFLVSVSPLLFFTLNYR